MQNQYEKNSKKGYATISRKTHEELKISDSGLVTYKKLAYIAAFSEVE